MSDAPATLNGSDAASAEASSPVLAALAAAFQHVTIGMAVATPDGRLIDANPAYARMLGYERDELLALGFEAGTYPGDAIIDRAQWERLAAGEMNSYQREKRYLRKDGSVMWGHVTVSALRDESGAFAGGFGHVQDITAQKLAEIALREQEAKLEALVSQLPVALYSVAPGASNAFQYVSPRFTQQTGLSHDDLPTSFDELLSRVHPADREAVRAADTHAERTGDPSGIEYRILGGNGEWIWVDHRSVLMRDEWERPLVWHGALLDVSERKWLEASLLESQERFRRAFEDAAIGMSLGTPDDICLDVNPAYCRIVGRSRDELLGRFFAEYTHPDDVKAYTQQQARLYADEVDAYQIEKRYLRPDGTVVNGLLVVSAVRGDNGAHLYDIGQLQDITAQRAAEAALRESEAHLRTILEQTPAAVYRLEPGASGKFTYTSPRFAALTGLSVERIQRNLEDYFARVHPDDVAMLREADSMSGRTGRPFDLEYRLRAADDSWIWVHDRAHRARDEQDGSDVWYGILLDITEQHELASSLRGSEARFRSLFESAGIGMTLTDPRGPILDVNPALCRLLGYSRDELREKTFLEITHPDDIDPSTDWTRKLATGELDDFSLEKRYIRKDGQVVWGHLTATAVRDEDGQLSYVIGQVQDATARKEAESALRASEARFRSIFEGAGIGMALSVPNGAIVVANRALERLLGYAPGELESVQIEDITYPDDLALQADHLQRMRRSELDAYHFEKRFVRKDGGVVWGLLNATSVKDDRGTIQAVIGQVQDISARKEAEAALRESEERFRAVWEATSEALALSDPDGLVLAVNPAYSDLYGLPADALVGQSCAVIFPKEARSAAVAQYHAAFADPDPPRSYEKRVQRPDGGARVVEARADFLVRDGARVAMISAVRDVTDRHAAEEALRESEARFRALVHNDPDVIVVVDEAMSLVYVSPSVTSALGLVPTEVQGPIEPNLHFIHPDDRERGLVLFEEVGGRPGATASVEIRIKHRQLGWRWFQVTIANLLQDPGIDGYLFNLRDITDAKLAELASEAALHAQESAIAELERLNQSKSRFLSTISHEFRTPLTAIIGYSELLIGNTADPAVVEDAAVIHREASRLNRLVDDVLLVDRVDDGRMSVNMTAVDCNTLAQDVLETFRPLIGKHRFSLDLDPSLRLVEGDRDRLSQALTNLVSNAVKYSPAGGVVTIVTRNASDDVVISVEDEGIGIAREDLSRIFDRFERVETGIAGRIAGTGLGLSIAQEIATLHGGRLWAESGPGRGSTFHLVIPAATNREPEELTN